MTGFSLKMFPTNESFLLGTLFSLVSEVNFIGNVSFDGNNAIVNGGKGTFEDSHSAIREV